MLIDSSFNMSMIRGDTESFAVSCREKGVTRNFVMGDIIHFTVKRTPSSVEKILQKSVSIFDEGKALINISSSDTSNIEIGEYVHDIQVTFANGMKKTLTAKYDENTGNLVLPKFRLFQEVTYE